MTSSSKNGKRIRYAVVGLGHIVQVAVLPAFSNSGNSELTTLVSDDKEKLSKLAKKYNVANTYSYKEFDRALLNVDAVYIGLPNHLHREHVVRAAEAGVHTLCEKPMAVNEKECQEMIEAADSNNVKLMIAYRLHFERANLEAISIVKGGKIGIARAFTSEFSQQVAPGNVRVTEPTAKGGGPVYDMGVYCINAARYLFQSEPTEVLAIAATRTDPRFDKTEETVSATLLFPGECLASFTCSFGAADISRYTMMGTKGSLTAEPAYDYSMGLKHRITVGEKTKTKIFPKRDQFAAEIAYFSDCVTKNRKPEPSGEEGLADVRIVEAIYESIRSGRTVKLARLSKKQRPSLKQELRRPAHGKPQIVKAKPPSAA